MIVFIFYYVSYLIYDLDNAKKEIHIDCCCKMKILQGCLPSPVREYCWRDERFQSSNIPSELDGDDDDDDDDDDDSGG